MKIANKNTPPNVATMALGDIQKLVNELHTKSECASPALRPKKGEWLWQPGKNYLIRTVSYHFTGRFVGFNGPNNSELAFDQAAWVADTGRFTQAVATGALSEVEPFPDSATIGINRTAVIDFVQIAWPVPRSQK